MRKILLLALFCSIVIGVAFFVVSSEIVEDKEINVKLPPWEPETSALESGANVKPRNVLEVLVDEKGDAIIREEKVLVGNIRALIKDFIINPQKKEDFAIRPDQAIISLKNEIKAPYKNYLNIYNEIKGAYNELWDSESRKQFNKDFKALSREQQKEIRKIIPLVISEAEPDDF